MCVCVCRACTFISTESSCDCRLRLCLRLSVISELVLMVVSVITVVSFCFFCNWTTASASVKHTGAPHLTSVRLYLFGVPALQLSAVPLDDHLVLRADLGQHSGQIRALDLLNIHRHGAGHVPTQGDHLLNPRAKVTALCQLTSLHTSTELDKCLCVFALKRVLTSWWSFLIVAHSLSRAVTSCRNIVLVDSYSFFRVFRPAMSLSTDWRMANSVSNLHDTVKW